MLVGAPLRGQKTFRPAVIPGFPDYFSQWRNPVIKADALLLQVFSVSCAPHTASTLGIYSQISKAPESVAGREDWIAGLAVMVNPSMK